MTWLTDAHDISLLQVVRECLGGPHCTYRFYTNIMKEDAGLDMESMTSVYVGYRGNLCRANAALQHKGAGGAGDPDVGQTLWFNPPAKPKTSHRP